MEPDREALRLSSLIALGVALYLITLSVDNFYQQKLPNRIGQADCSWWQSTLGTCKANLKNPRKITQRDGPFARNS